MMMQEGKKRNSIGVMCCCHEEEKINLENVDESLRKKKIEDDEK